MEDGGWKMEDERSITGGSIAGGNMMEAKVRE
jgi:hypothetical protein